MSRDGRRPLTDHPNFPRASGESKSIYPGWGYLYIPSVALMIFLMCCGMPLERPVLSTVVIIPLTAEGLLLLASALFQAAHFLAVVRPEVRSELREWPGKPIVCVDSQGLFYRVVSVSDYEVRAKDGPARSPTRLNMSEVYLPGAQDMAPLAAWAEVYERGEEELRLRRQLSGASSEAEKARKQLGLCRARQARTEDALYREKNLHALFMETANAVLAGIEEDLREAKIKFAENVLPSMRHLDRIDRRHAADVEQAYLQLARHKDRMAWTPAGSEEMKAVLHARQGTREAESRLRSADHRFRTIQAELAKLVPPPVRVVDRRDPTELLDPAEWEN